MLSMIACCSRNRVIGRDGKIPWRLPADLSFFKRKTMGSAVLMGRFTWESLGGYILSGRDMVVVTSLPKSMSPSGVNFVSSPEDAVILVNGAKPIFIMGGARLYAWGLIYAKDLFLTEIHEDYEGDVVFPALTDSWYECSREEGSEPYFEHKFDFVHYHNRSPLPVCGGRR
ncbi:Dihydrofolate reductase [Candidatus Ichthyocystis hellenicum]|uniref:Dihydrofolate reductase n=2 Tax=Burkholderiales genera incertae sedis TaxID=224471 RepID=A0A0S4M4K9_9BURK|nr:Dihydrofolate reductase [Candidatus Ichthyocystis hellenicum]